MKGSNSVKFETAEMRIGPARYAKDKCAVHCASDGSGMKTRAARVASVIGGNCYSNRERAYIVSPRKASRIVAHFTAGGDACPISGELEAAP